MVTDRHNPPAQINGEHNMKIDLPKQRAPWLFILVTALVSSWAHAQPNFSKQFLPNTIGPGSHSQLEFLISNTAGVVASDLAFVDNLPAGMEIASPNGVFSDCGEAQIVAPAGGSTITVTDGEALPSTFCFIRVNVTSSTAGTMTNTTGDLTSSQGNSGTATADLTVATDRPGFSKNFAPSTIGFGERSTLTFTIDNTLNADPMTSLTFTDNLPTGMVVADPANVVTDCNGSLITAAPNSSTISQGPISFNTDMLDAGATCTVAVDVRGDIRGTANNVSGDFISNRFALRNSGFATDSLTISNSGNLVLVQNFVADPVNPGSTVDLEFTINNFSRTDSATGITFSNDLDTALSGLVATGLPLSDPCGAGSSLTGTSLLSFSGGELPPEGSCTFAVTLQVPAAAASGIYPNTTSAVSANETTGDAATESLFINQAPTLSKTFLNNPIGAGETTSMEFTISNSSTTSDATAITFTDDIGSFLSGATVSALPAAGFCGAGSLAFSFVDAGNLTLQINDANLLAGESCTFTVDITTQANTPGGDYLNTTSAISGVIDGNPVQGNSATDNLTVVSGPDVQISFTDDPAAPGSTVTANVTITHDVAAPGDATAISFDWDLNATLASLAANGLPQSDVCGAGSSITGITNLSFTDGVLAPGESCSFNLSLQVPAGATPGSYFSTTTAPTATVFGVNTQSLAAQDTLVIAGLQFSKSFIDDPVIPGDLVTLRYSIDNVSASDATGIFFTDNFSTVISGLAAEAPLPTDPCGAGSQVSGTTFLIVTGGNLTAGTSCTFDVNIRVPGGAAAGQYGSLTSNLTATIDGQTAVLPAAQDALEVETDRVALSMAFIDDPVAAGDQVTVEYTLTNQDVSRVADGLSFTHDLDGTLSGLSALGLPLMDVCGSGSMLSGGSLLTLTGANLSAGGSCTFSYSVQVPVAAVGGQYPSATSGVTGTLDGLPITGPVATDTLDLLAMVLSMAFDNPTDAGRTTRVYYDLSNESLNEQAGFRFVHDLAAVAPGFAVVGSLPTDPCGSGSVLSVSGTINLDNGSLSGEISCQFSLEIRIAETQAFGSYNSSTSAVTRTGELLANSAAADLVISGEQSVRAARVADYLFDSDLTSEVPGAPDLVYPGTLDYTTDLVGTTSKTVLPFAAGDGFKLLAGALNVSDEYTLAILVALDDVTGYVKLADFKALSADFGLYNNSGDLEFFDLAAGTSALITDGSYAQVILTRAANGQVTGYVNGVQQFTFTDNTGLAVIDNFENALNLMIDETGDEDGSGRMARVTLFDVPFEQQQVDDFSALGDLIFFNGFD